MTQRRKNGAEKAPNKIKKAKMRKKSPKEEKNAKRCQRKRKIHAKQIEKLPKRRRVLKRKKTPKSIIKGRKEVAKSPKEEKSAKMNACN